MSLEPDNPWFVMDSSTNNIFAEMLPDAATLGMDYGLHIFGELVTVKILQLIVDNN